MHVFTDFRQRLRRGGRKGNGKIRSERVQRCARRPSNFRCRARWKYNLKNPTMPANSRENAPVTRTPVGIVRRRAGHNAPDWRSRIFTTFARLFSRVRVPLFHPPRRAATVYVTVQRPQPGKPPFLFPLPAYLFFNPHLCRSSRDAEVWRARAPKPSVIVALHSDLHSRVEKQRRGSR